MIGRLFEIYLWLQLAMIVGLFGVVAVWRWNDRKRGR